MSAEPIRRDARSEILGRIRTALPGAPAGIAASYASVRRAYDRRGQLDRAACLELFLDRLVDYDAEVLQLQDAESISAAVDSTLAHHSEPSVLVAEEFPAEWLPRAALPVRDHSLTTAQLEAHPAVLTTCEVAVASTGTIVLAHRGAQGRRALTLLPDHHICIVQRDQVLELLPEALERIASVAHLPLTTISGPSATSDIEMTRVRGVHGPRRLTVILYS
jgi:L-lactate dehydrogenase complex protein LldG